ncbi:peroxidase family protein [Bosea sp. 2RAB26]|uniref:peroxidase family protein n=1 Tax=Bosea sp. 2RAB26 TaxID=3237476 RepID=UPI003F8F24D7
MVTFDRVDLDYILQQILMAEAGQGPVNPHLAFGLREVAGTNNNQSTGAGGSTSTYGSIDQPLPFYATQLFQPGYAAGTPFVVDSTPRTISNLISDQSSANQAAVDAYNALHPELATPLTVQLQFNPDGTANSGYIANLGIANVTPDGGISAPFNTWFTLFGQFFDHGLDLISKSQTEIVFIPLLPDDPLYVQATATNPNPNNFMVLARAVQPTLNLVTPFVDQNQTYTSHPSHQAFLREYLSTPGALAGTVTIEATGRLLEHTDATGAKHLATWADVKANALKLGIALTDYDVGNVPLLATDAYGNLILGAHGFAQVVVAHAGGGTTLVEGTATGLDLTDPLPLESGEKVVRIGHAFINDMAHAASPFDSSGNLLQPDSDGLAGGPAPAAGLYDNELLDSHFVGGDGRANENIGLTTVHEVFHNEHNRLIEQTKAMVRGELAKGDTSFALNWVLSGANLADGIQDDEWDGARLFQAAKFGTETQYQHLVFEEFARKVVPTIHVAGDTNIHLDAAITSEFANAVYRFGHSMLDETIDRFDANGNPVLNPATNQQMTLIDAFTNPLAFLAQGSDAAAQIIRGATQQVGNEIDEFVTGALRNNLLGLPLDLAALNLARGRDTGVPTLNAFRHQIYDQTHDANLRPYQSWDDFGHYLKHPASLVNFIAAYGTHAALTAEATVLDKRTAALDLMVSAQKTMSLNYAFRDAAGNLTSFKYTDAGLKHTDFAFVDQTGRYTEYGFTDAAGHLTKSALDSAGNANIANTANTLNADNIGNADPSQDAGKPILDGFGHQISVANTDFSQDAYDFLHSHGAYGNADPATSTNANLIHDANGAVALWSTGSITGLDQVDMWIGGLAEKQALNGSLLGSTFELIFRVQLENLQDGDRLYYLPRIEGTHYSDQIENNSFAEMIQANIPGTHHLPASIFQAMEYQIEAKDYYQLGANGNVLTDANGNPLLRANPTFPTWTDANGVVHNLVEITKDGTLHFIGKDFYFGNTMVLGGTDANDKLLAGNADDDTVWGDGGNDTIDGGGGNDNLFGGSGDDLITDQAGDNVVHGDDGNDTILLGKGADIVFGGAGDDYISSGGGIDDVVGGAGNDIILAGEGGEEVQGDQGDDWIDGGKDGGDVLIGDVGAPTGETPLYTGNDVLIGGVGTVMKGFGGDDIMLGVGGFDKFLGGTGFDWASFELETQAVSVDMKRREFISPINPLGGDGIRDVFSHTEGVSGSQFDDEILGANDPRAVRAAAKDALLNPNLILGLADTPADSTGKTYTNHNGTLEGSFFAPGVGGPNSALGFAGGDILLGGAGNDRIAGGGGDDIIDGDAWLHVALQPNAQGVIGAGSQILREIRYDDTHPNNVDTAVYSDNASNYTITVRGAAGATVVRQLDAATIAGLASGAIQLAPDAQGFVTVAHTPAGAVAATKNAVDDGTDRLRNIERLEFADVTVDVSGGRNHIPVSTLTVTDRTGNIAAPAVGDTLSSNFATAGVIKDADFAGGIITTPISYQWQYQDLIRAEWINITGATNPNALVPGDFEEGLQIRLKATYTDAHGYTETVTSAPTPLLAADPGKNFGPTQNQRVVQLVDNVDAYQGEKINVFVPITNFWTDDHTANTALHFAATLANGQILDGSAAAFGLRFTLQSDATGITGATITGQLPVGFNGAIDLRFYATDDAITTPAGVVLPAHTSTADFAINVLNTTGNVANNPAAAVTAAAAPAAPAADPMGVSFDRVDLDWILNNIKMAEAHQPPVNPHLAFGLREVAATNNSAVSGQGTFGASDQSFLRLTTPVLGLAQDNPFAPGLNLTSYAQTHGSVYDSNPRMISNLIVDQSAANPAALEAATSQATVMPAVQDPNKVAALDGFDPTTGLPNYSIPNVTPDGGISAPFNTWFTLFGQFFDHGLDLVNKGGNGSVIIPLLPDDPLYKAGSPTNFMVLTRGTMIERTAGADGIVGTSDDTFTHETTNAITPPVDQSQTYSSHPSHQVFLREYINVANAGQAPNIHSTGRMLDHVNQAGATQTGNADATAATTDLSHHMPTWADVKKNALDNLGLKLSDYDVVSVPLVQADAYGNVIRGPNGFAQVVYQVLATDSTTHITTLLAERTIEGTAAGLDIDHIAVPAGLAAPPNATLSTQYVGAGVAFINDMAHNASPFNDFGQALTADGDGVAGNALPVDPATGQNLVYDNELLDAHYIAGDGRVNENVGLTAVHDVFHSEHNRLVEQTKAFIQAQLNKGDTSFASEWVLPGVNLAPGTGGTAHQITATEWNGERLFQVARFGTETQYQHLVFEEFARKIAPDIHVSGDTNIHLDPAVFAEFAHTVYRFGHSMLDENLQRYSLHHGADGDPLNGTPELDANGNPILLDGNGNQVSSNIALLTAFTNPLAYLNGGADASGQLALGSMAQIGNEIDEFVTGTLRNNLLGLPLDLASLNIARGRSEGVPGINLVRNELYSQTNDASLKPYESWHEFGQFLKHPASLINFVAAYGTHATIVNATTLADKRAAALALVSAGENEANRGTDAYDFMHSTGNYANNVNDPRAYHGALIDPTTGSAQIDPVTHQPMLDQTPPHYSTGSVTGLDAVDLWIGGLAEKQNLHGGLLGTTFDYVFKLQMENLQDADRLYYLPRIEGMQFSDQIENNSFAEMVMNATGVHHISASIFLTPEYKIEATDFYQHNADGSVAVDSHNNPIFAVGPAIPSFTGTDGQLHPLVEIQGDGTVHFLGEDNFFGNTMVLGGTSANDRLMAGQADDDTVWGDAGDDIIDGGGGNDNLFGGDGNDILSNTNSSIGSSFHGDGGDDTIYGSKGDDLIFGGAGNDLIYGNQGVDDIVGGSGNDIIYGGEGGEEIQGDEGDDWIDGGPDGGDVLIGDVGAPTGQFPLYAGDDVLIGGVGTVMKGFSGDDIMLGVGGFDKFLGGLGFDWASFERETQSVAVDMSIKEFIAPDAPLGADGIRDIFTQTEGLSGSRFDDILTADNNARAPIVPLAKNQLNNPGLIKGLADGPVDGFGNPQLSFINGTTEGAFFKPGTAVGITGNIVLGGGGNDIIEGGRGDDVIDGDAWLHVELLPNAAGVVGLGSQILREIRYDTTPGNIDTAVFTGNASDYTIDGNEDAEGFITVVDSVAGRDGTDRLRNIERLQFVDTTIDVSQIDFAVTTHNHIPQANPSIGGAALQVILAAGLAAPQVDSALTADVTNLVDFDFAGGTITNPLSFQWQYLNIARGAWVNIADPALHPNGATTATFTPTDFFLGQQLRVVVTYADPAAQAGFVERVVSAPTAVLVPDPLAANTAPFVVAQQELVGLPNTAAAQDKPITNMFLPLTTVFGDRETAATALTYTAAIVDANGTAHPITNATSFMGLSFTVDRDATGAVTDGHITGTPPAGLTGGITARITAMDPQGLAVTNDFTIDVLGRSNGTPVFGSNPVNAQFNEFTTAAVTAAQNLSTPAGTLIANLSATDTLTAFQIANHQAAAPLAWSIVNGDALTQGLFKIGATTDTVTAAGVTSAATLVFNQAPDFEAIKQQLGGNPNASINAAGTEITFTIQLQVSDGDQTAIQTEIVRIENVNEAASGAVHVGGFSASTANAVLAGTDTLADPDLITAANPTGRIAGINPPGTAAPFQWQQWNGTAWVNITGAAGTAPSLTIANQTVRLTASYGDVFGANNPANTPAAMISPETFVVGNGNGNTLSGDVPAGLFANGHNRTFLGLSGVDTVSYANDASGVAVNLLDPTKNTGIAVGDKYVSIENVTGGSGNDILTGDANANALTGGVGDDLFIATVNDGNDNYAGGAGIDTYDLSATSAGAVVTTSSATSSQIGNDTLSGIENIIGSQGADTITVNGGVNVIDGQGGNDIIDAGAGIDTVHGGSGDDIITGGTGNDALFGDAGNDSFIYTIGHGADAVDGGADTDKLIITGTNASDTLNVVFSGTTLTAFEGGTITGIEQVTADLGSNSGSGDTLSYAGTTAAVTVNLGAGTASGFTSIANIENVTGGSGDDSLTGNGGNNTLNGGLGNDTLNGGGGTDTMIGGAGDDIYITDGNDTLTEAANQGTDTVRSSVTFTLANNFENLTLTGNGNINGTGNNAANVIIGNGGNNTLTGGAGNDVMTGGAGSDTFLFNTTNESGVGVGNNDVITDFEGAGVAGGDIIDLSAIDANTGSGGNQAFTFIGSAAFSAAGQVRVIQSGGDTVVQLNTNNNVGTIEMEIKLAGLHSLAAGDFIL